MGNRPSGLNGYVLAVAAVVASAAVRAGLGLGLTIARRLVELHGGAVEASSGGEGHGATFVVMLPLAAPDVRTVAPERDTG